MVIFCRCGKFLLMLFFLLRQVGCCPLIFCLFTGKAIGFPWLIGKHIITVWFFELIWKFNQNPHFSLLCILSFLAAYWWLLRQKLPRNPALLHKSITLFFKKIRRAHFKKDKHQPFYPLIFLSMAGIFSENMLKKGLNQGIFSKNHEKKRLNLKPLSWIIHKN